MKHRMVFAAMAASVIIAGACADRDGGERLVTEPPSGGKPVVSYVTSGAVAVVDRRTHRLTPVTADASRSGISASIATGSSDVPPLQLTIGEPGIARSGGKAVFTFTDDAHHKHQMVLLYRSPGGPPAAVQHYTDGVLVNTTAYVWGKTSNGWVRTQSTMQSLRNGALVGTITYTTVPAKPGSTGGPIDMVMLDRAPVVSTMQKAVGAFAYGLAYALGPEDAKAQTYSFYDCRIYWLHYVGSAVALAAAASALGAAPELTPMLLSAFVSALTSTAIYEDQLLECIIAHQSLASGGFGGGGGAFWPDGKWDCFEGSYSAHCTTAFTV
jgi:hypothetical protein